MDANGMIKLETGISSGARICTVRGRCNVGVAIEDLAIGDRVVTASGQVRAIRRIGHRPIERRGQGVLMPVRIAAHAFGDNKPERDLIVAPGQAVSIKVVDEVLIPAAALVNDTTITRAEAGGFIVWNLELDSHDVILADNLPTETCRNPRRRLAVVGAEPPAIPNALALRFYHEGLLVEVVRARLRVCALALGWAPEERSFGSATQPRLASPAATAPSPVSLLGSARRLALVAGGIADAG